MLKEVLYINIGYKNGLYTFENDSICKEIPKEIQVNTPFFNEENSLEELVDVIAEEPENHLVFSCNGENYPLIKTLADTLSYEYDRTIYFVGEGITKTGKVADQDRDFYLLNNYEQLLTLDDLDELPTDELKTLSFSSDIKNAGDGYFLAMKNGYTAFMTGVYPENMSNTLAKHIKVENSEDLEGLSQYLDVNGALIVSNEKESDEQLNHIHVDEEERISFDKNGYSLKKMVCSYEKYNEWKSQGKVKEDTTYYLKIENKEDLAAFANELDTYIETGRIPTQEKRLVDECRWTNECSLKRMTRYEVRDQKIHPCLTSDYALTDVETDNYEKVMEANKLFDSTIIFRNCVACDLNNTCSKCACMAKGMEKDDFCTFMHQYMFVQDYLLKSRIVQYLGKQSKIFAGHKNIGVSSAARGLVYPLSNRSHKNCKPLYLFECDDQYFYLNMKGGSLIRLESKFVFLLEAWSAGEKQGDIIQNMMQLYSISEQQALELVEEGYHHLEKGGMLCE